MVRRQAPELEIAKLAAAANLPTAGDGDADFEAERKVWLDAAAAGHVQLGAPKPTPKPKAA